MEISSSRICDIITDLASQGYDRKDIADNITSDYNIDYNDVLSKLQTPDTPEAYSYAMGVANWSGDLLNTLRTSAIAGNIKAAELLLLMNNDTEAENLRKELFE